ncbi:hypothetical protein DPMN_142183 [Dreissena polymorpha]|uniref:Uncharacterized protein n=1 Tax=Dreissena polymorpha TaxID=45954 RepID=A0A9D4GBC5_DREPO|nr:hypothetical protein DPMN_142183 [Dreissena polymorpha]
MSGNGRGVRRRMEKAVAKKGQRERGGGYGQSIRHRRKKKGQDGEQEEMRREGRRYQSRYQLLFLNQSQTRHSQQRHLQNVNAQKITSQMVSVLISVLFSAQTIGYHVVTTRVSTKH